MKFNIKTLPQKSGKYLKGNFEDYKPLKYFGKRPIIYRSSWELRFMRTVELNSEVLRWSSENIKIPYTMRELVNGRFVEKKHTYYPDFVVELKNGLRYLIEVKPMSQSPTNKKDIQRDPVMYKNARKWKAALEWAKQNNYLFRIINETHLETKIF